MRIPLQTYGFSLAPFQPALDLRNAVEGTEDILYFLTLRACDYSGIEIHIVDDRDDGPRVIFTGLAPFEPVFERLPVRGPVGIVITNVSDSFTGHLELEGSDDPTFFIPLAPRSFDDTQSKAIVCRIESSVNLSLFVHAPAEGAEGSACTLRFVPDDESVDSLRNVKFKGPKLGQLDKGFVQIFDRMPVLGPGRIEIDINSVLGGPISIYGFLSD